MAYNTPNGKVSRVNDWFTYGKSIDDIKLVIKNDLKQKDYMIQSEWLSIENCESTNSEMRPSEFKYDPIIKDIDYWRL
jgi:hypothetical protein